MNHAMEVREVQAGQLFAGYTGTWRNAQQAKVSVKAMHLLAIFGRLWKKYEAPCYTSLAKLAKWMGDDVGVTSTRQVQRYVEELRGAGLLRVEKRRGVNHYWPMSSCDTVSSSASSNVSSNVSSPINTKVNKEPKDNNSDDDDISPQKTEARKQLQALGLSFGALIHPRIPRIRLHPLDRPLHHLHPPPPHQRNITKIPRCSLTT